MHAPGKVYTLYAPTVYNKWNYHNFSYHIEYMALKHGMHHLLRVYIQLSFSAQLEGDRMVDPLHYFPSLS